ncbi:MAG: hypothetical protein EWM47_10640 [Anaerolineaceae bacterium]|nr:MAG: hypothetical protein EWM47_10640 [Anaerolineaceae bacterium]
MYCTMVDEFINEFIKGIQTIKEMYKKKDWVTFYSEESNQILLPDNGGGRAVKEFLFVDKDDEWKPFKLETYKALIKEWDEVLIKDIFGNEIFLGEDSIDLNKFYDFIEKYSGIKSVKILYSIEDIHYNNLYDSDSDLCYFHKALFEFSERVFEGSKNGLKEIPLPKFNKEEATDFILQNQSIRVYSKYYNYLILMRYIEKIHSVLNKEYIDVSKYISDQDYDDALTYSLWKTSGHAINKAYYIALRNICKTNGLKVIKNNQLKEMHESHDYIFEENSDDVVEFISDFIIDSSEVPIEEIKYILEEDYEYSFLDTFSGDLSTEIEIKALAQRLIHFDFVAAVAACRIYPNEIEIIKDICNAIDDKMALAINLFLDDRTFYQKDILSKTDILDIRRLSLWNGLTLENAYVLRDKCERAAKRLGFDIDDLKQYVEERRGDSSNHTIYSYIKHLEASVK